MTSEISRKSRSTLASIEGIDPADVVRRHEAGEPVTLREIAAVLGVSPERARQLEERAIKRLRAVCERLGMRPEDVLGMPRGEHPLAAIADPSTPDTRRHAKPDPARAGSSRSAVCVDCGVTFDLVGHDNRSRHCPTHRRGPEASWEARSASETAARLEELVADLEDRASTLDELTRRAGEIQAGRPSVPRIGGKGAA